MFSIFCLFGDVARWSVDWLAVRRRRMMVCACLRVTVECKFTWLLWLEQIERARIVMALVLTKLEYRDRTS